MGAPPLLCRGRMPVFGYLSEDEAADVYLYLTLHPPHASATMTASIASGEPVPPFRLSLDTHVPIAANRSGPEPISLLRFAFPEHPLSFSRWHRGAVSAAGGKAPLRSRDELRPMR
jgi:hypothetical protein